MKTPHRIGGALAGLLLFSATFCLAAADFRIDDVRWQNGRTEVSFVKEPAFYYILWRGEQPTEIRLVIDLALGSVPPNSLADTNATNSSRFYRVEKVPMTSLRDTDGDDINDAWELLYRHPGAALNGTDVEEDHNGNGVPDRLDALRESLREGGVRGRPVLAAGLYYTLAIKNDGTLWGWGDNLFGQLGSAAFTETNSPVQIGSDADWIAVSANDFFSWGLKTNGTLWFWGRSSPMNLFVPTQVGTNTNWVGVPEGKSSKPIALQSDGTRWQFPNSPTNAEPYDTNNIWAAVGDSSFEHWAIRNDGTLWKAAAGISTNIFDTNRAWASISLGRYHALAVRTNGTLWAWDTSIGGQARDGQLGLGNSFPSTPTQVGTNTWAAVAAGGFHSIGVKSDGSLWWWGGNFGFQPGGAAPLTTNLPTQFGTNTDWVSVTAGDQHTAALRADGTVWTFGMNELGKIGNGTVGLVKSPIQVGTDYDWNALAAGTVFSFGLKTNGTLWAWGGNALGVLGVGDFASDFLPRQIPGSNWIAVSGGNDHTAALQSDGSLWIWGKYIRGVTQFQDVFTNIPVQLGTDTDWRFISAGSRHALALKNNGSLWSWGRDSVGSLGNGAGYSSIPLQVGSASWANVSAGHNNSLGIQASTSLWSWGQQIGALFSDSQPQQIYPFDFSWRFVANGKRHLNNSHALALKHGGTLWSWGYNFNGQLGNGTTAPRSRPEPVGLSTNWSAIVVGGSFSGALQQDGSLWLWGDNSFGQLGSGSRIGTNLVSQAGIETNWTAIAAGYRHMLALKADGSIWAWGDNSYGQCAQPALFEPAPVPGTNWGKPHQ